MNPNFTRSLRGLLALGLALGALASTSCAGDEPAPTEGLVLRVFNSSTSESEGFPPSIADRIDEVRVRIYQNGREQSELTRTFVFSEPSGRLPKLEFGENYQIVVEALDEDDTILADGATPVFDYLSGDRLDPIQVFTSALNSVEYASALFTSGNQLLSLPSEFEGWFVADTRGEPRDEYGGQRAGHTVTQLTDGRIAVIGGGRMASEAGIGGSPLAALTDTIEIYNPYTGYWTLLLDNTSDDSPQPAVRLSAPRAFHTATLMDDNRILVAGGFEADGSQLAASSRVEIIDVAKGTIEVLGFQTEDLFDPRALHTAHWFNGRLYIVGGVGRFYDSPSYLSSVEVFDPAAGFFERALDPDTGDDLNLLVGRGLHTSHALVDGIVVIGGRTATGVTPTLEFLEVVGDGLHRYFDDAGVLPSMAVARFAHESVLMQPDFENSTPDDLTTYIAIAGGYIATAEGSDTLRGSALTNTIEFVNERSFQSNAGIQLNMATPRAHFEMVETTITNDLMMLGGITTDNVTTNVERFLRTDDGGFPLRPVNFGQLHKGRAFATAVMLQTHNVMVIGGWDGGSDVSACGNVLNAGCTSELANPGDLFFLGFLY